MSLSSEHLAELTALVNDRLLEFESDNILPLSRGLVRIVLDVLDEWHGEALQQVPTVVCPPAVSVVRVEKVTPPVSAEPVHANGHDTHRDPGKHTARTSVIPTTAELIAELKRMSMAGTMPTMSQFDQAKPAVWATAQAHLHRFRLFKGVFRVQRRRGFYD